MGLCHRFVDRICQSSERWSTEEALESSKQSLRGSLRGSHKTRMPLGFRQEGSLNPGGSMWEQGLCWELDSR